LTDSLIPGPPSENRHSNIYGSRPTGTDELRSQWPNARKLANARHNRGKLLDPLGRIDFAHEYVPERVDADRICKVKLTSEATISAEVPERLST
jgi:hypothetical protein